MSGLRVLLTGSGGQVGTALRRSAPAGIELTAFPSAALDIGSAAAVLDAIAGNRPQLVINAAAYTAVDKAEAEPEQAFRVNRDGPAHLADACVRHGARLIHLSTDFVFDGKSSSPYRPDDAPHPLSVYGHSKLDGETAVRERLGNGSLIVRTGWVYYPGGRNFVATILKLLRERPQVRVIADQVGTPTHAAGLATLLWSLAGRAEVAGTLHWTDAGVASWYDFAQAIARLARQAEPGAAFGEVIPIQTEDYPLPAQRPRFSVLDKTATWQISGIAPTHWQDRLAAGFADLLAGR